MNFERYAPFGMYGAKYAPRTPVKPLGEAKEDWRIALEIGCLVDKPENFFYGDPVKACNAVLKVWEGNYEKAVAALPAVSTLKCEKNEPYKYVFGELRRTASPASTRRRASSSSSPRSRRSTVSRVFPSTRR